MSRKRSEDEIRATNAQQATFRCGISGCPFRYVGRMDEWLRVRDSHRAEAHPTFTERKRKTHSIRGINRKARYEEATV